MRLPELLDMAIVQKLADANFVANGMPLGIIDAHDGAVLVGRGWQDICTQFHRVHPDSARRCRESDEYIKDHLSESAACEYTCKNGLRDIGVPIVVSGEHVATLFLGQFFYEGESPDRGFFMRQARAFGFDQDSYLAALDRVPSFSRRSVEDVVEYDRALARFIADLAESALRHERDRQALRDSESRFRGLAEAMPQLVWVAGAEGNASYLNPSWTDYTGGGGRAAQERMELVHPDDRGRVAECWRAATRAGTGFACEHRLRRHDGVYRWFLTRSTVTRSEAGEVRWIGTATDIHDLKRADEELAVLTGLYAILSEVNEAIVRTRDERSLYEDVCRIIMQQGGLPLVWIGLVRGREIAPVACRGPAADYLREIRVEVDGELGNGPTGTCVREDRPVINDDFDRNPRTSPWRAPALRHGLRASAAFPLHRQGRVIGALTLYAVGAGAFTPEQIKLLEALCADVSYALDSIEQERLRTKAEDALRESERNLRDTDRRKDEFLGVLSHELRNPLAPIRNALYLLDRAPAGGEQASGAKAVIARQVDHLARLVDDLLDVTRISRGKIQLQRSRFDLVEVVERTVEDHRRLLAAREISLDADLGARAAAGARRSHPHRAGRVEPAPERREVHGPGRAHHGDRRARGRLREHPGGGHRDRHLAGDARVPVRAVHAGGEDPAPQPGRARARALAREGPRGDARGDGGRAERRERARVRVHRPAPPRPGRGGGAARDRGALRGASRPPRPRHRGQPGRGRDALRGAPDGGTRGRARARRRGGRRAGARAQAGDHPVRHRAARDGRLRGRALDPLGRDPRLDEARRAHRVRAPGGPAPRGGGGVRRARREARPARAARAAALPLARGLPRGDYAAHSPSSVSGRKSSVEPGSTKSAGCASSTRSSSSGATTAFARSSAREKNGPARSPGRRSAR